MIGTLIRTQASTDREAIKLGAHIENDQIRLFAVEELQGFFPSSAQTTR